MLLHLQPLLVMAAGPLYAGAAAPPIVLQSNAFRLSIDPVSTKFMAVGRWVATLTDPPRAQTRIGGPVIFITVVLGDHNSSSFRSAKFSTETSTQYCSVCTHIRP